jgi:hypothetical protein
MALNGTIGVAEIALMIAGTFDVKEVDWACAAMPEAGT